MREKKFRFWNRKTKQMASWDDMENGTSNRLCSEFQDIRNEENEIMQYTGLKDKNGKDIYEGDILKFGEEIKIVRWNEKESGFTGVFFSEKEEIIGNVYENQDLLSTQPSQE